MKGATLSAHSVLLGYCEFSFSSLLSLFDDRVKNMNAVTFYMRPSVNEIILEEIKLQTFL